MSFVDVSGTCILFSTPYPALMRSHFLFVVYTTGRPKLNTASASFHSLLPLIFRQSLICIPTEQRIHTILLNSIKSPVINYMNAQWPIGIKASWSNCNASSHLSFIPSKQRWVAFWTSGNHALSTLVVIADLDFYPVGIFPPEMVLKVQKTNQAWFQVRTIIGMAFMVHHSIL